MTIGQPGLFPWWGTFAKAEVSDIVVHLDHVSWQKGGYLNRFRLESQGSETWCTIPLRRPSMGTPIDEVLVEPPSSSLEKHLAALRRAEAHPCDEALHLMRRLYGSGEDSVLAADLAIRSTEESAGILGISPRFLRSSQLELVARSTRMILEILRIVGGDAYIFGPGARGIDRHYLDVSMLLRNGIRVGIASYALRPRVSILQDIATLGRRAMLGRTIDVEWLR